MEGGSLPSVFPSADKNSCNLFVGKRRSGKSTLMQNLLRYVYAGQFDFIYIFYPAEITAIDHPYSSFIIEPKNGGHFYEYSADTMNSIILKHSKIAAVDKSIRWLIVLDDMVNEDNFKNTVGSDPLNKLAQRGRHINGTIYILSQSLTSVSKKFRENCDTITWFNHNNNSDLFYKENSFCSDKKEAQRLIKYSTSSTHGFMVISIFKKGGIFHYDSDKDSWEFIKCS